MGFLGLPSDNGDYGGETGSPVLLGTSPTPSDPGSGGSFLNELGSFVGITSTGIASILRSTSTPPPVVIPRTTNVPSSSLVRLSSASGSSNVLIWVLIGLAVAIGIKFLRK